MLVVIAFVAGAVVAVTVPKVYAFIAKQVASARAKL